MRTDERTDGRADRQRSREGQRDEILKITGAGGDYTNVPNTATKIQNETYLGLLPK
jgi:hypothetical protein